MKKITIVLLFSLSFPSVSADCMYEETNPVCSITGQTFTNSCQGWSDTSSWSLPQAYNGTCNAAPELSQDEKTKVYEIIIRFLESRDYLIESDNGYTLTQGIYSDPFTGEASSTNNGVYFISKLFFPAVAEYIKDENAKMIPNTEMIAVLNEASRLIGYDYYIKKQ